VQHPCPRCGVAVEDSAPFCSSCGAPQVRFAPSETPPEAVKVSFPDASAPSPGRPEVATPSATRAGRNSALRAAISAGTIAALLSLLPLGFILGSPLGGFLSVLFYRRRTWAAEPAPSAAFRLGALTGIVGYGIFLILAAAQLSVLHGQHELRDAMIEAVHRQQARNPDPQARQMLDYFLTPHGLMVMMVLGLVLMGVIFVLLSGVGGALSAALLRRKGPPS
jgi:MFS family permease